MNQADEDALVERAMHSMESTFPGAMPQAIRLAIRAAVAQERERCAYICDRWSGVGDVVARAIATAIRRGE